MAGIGLLTMLLAAGGCAKGGGGGKDDVDAAFSFEPDAPTGGGPDAPAAPDTDAPTSAGADAPTGGPDATGIDATGIDASGIDASGCPTAPCDLVEQCGCTPPAVCDLDFADPSTGATACRTVTAFGTETSTCALTTDCAGGYICINDGLAASCKPYCNTDADCTAPGGLCILELSSGGTPIPGAVVCSINCTPTTGDGCPAGWGCNLYFVDRDGAGPMPSENLTDCDTAGLGGQGAPCTTNSSCQVGYTCTTTDPGPPAVMQCLHTCDVTGGGVECGATETCYSFDTPAVVGGVEYGVCFDPFA